MGPGEISETTTERKICCLTLFLVYIVQQHFCPRLDELRKSLLVTAALTTQPQHESKHCKELFLFADKCRIKCVPR